MKEELTFRDYIEIINKRLWSVIIIFLLFFCSVAAVTFLMTPEYRATAQVYIDPGQGSQYTFDQQGGARNPADSQAYLQTEINILKSDAIARQVVTKLHLYQDQDSKGPFSLAALFGISRKPDEGASMDSLVRRFSNDLDVEIVKNSSLVKVSYEAGDPQKAAQVANETVKAFIQQNVDMRVSPAKEYMAWFNDELGKIKARMTDASNYLDQFKQKRDLVVSGEKGNPSVQALTDLNSKVLAAEAQRYVAEIKYQQVQKLSKQHDGLMSLPEVINNRVIQDLKAEEGTLAKQLAELSKKYGDKHPQIVRLNNEVDTLKKRIQGEVGLIVGSIRNDYEQASKSEGSLRTALARQKAAAMSYERSAAEYELKKQDLQGAREIYDQVLKKFQESNVMGSNSVSTVQLFDKATPPKRPAKPNKPLNLALGLLLGAFTAVGFAIVSERLDNTYTSPDELEEHLGLPILGVVPRSAANDPAKPDYIVSVSDPISPAAESFRTIRSNILLSRREATPRVLQICSALHSEGKSTVSINLSCIMAGAGEKVLLIDGDMRRPRLHKSFDVPNSRGLSSVLTSKAGLDDVIKKTKVFNLSFMPSGPLYSNPAELLGSQKMFEVITELKEQYERIIIDCPPYLGIADSSLLTPLSDGIVLVVRSGKTIRGAVLKIKKNIENIKAEIIGVVLNDMPGRSVNYYYHYNYSNYISKNNTSP